MDKHPALYVRAFRSDESGVLTAFGLFMFVITLMISAYAVDYWNAVQARTHLQINADATAHAALVSREFGTSDAATSAAMSLAYANMPKAKFGDIVDATDITFGTWNATDRTFTADPSSRQAVQVTMHETSARKNPVGTLLYKLVGINSFDINVKSVFETYYRNCLTQGFVAQSEVDIESNDSYLQNFCIHSNDKINVQSNGFFDAGTQVTMPDPSTIELPSSGFATDVGLKEALGADSWDIRILNQMADIYSGLMSGDRTNQYMPASYVTNYVASNYTSTKIGSGDLTPGNIYNINCSGNQTLSVSTGTVIDSVVITTNCPIKFGSGVTLQNAVVFTTNTDPKSISAASGLQIGKNDNCADGGGAQVLTYGGVSIPAALSMYGGQMIAKGDVSFAANANGIQGASIVSGGTITGTSNMTMAYCNGGMEQNFQAEYFRLVQ